MVSDNRTGKRVALRHVPRGVIVPDDFVVEAQEIPIVGEGEFLIRNLFVSVDPMLRLVIDPAALGGKMPAIAVGMTIPGAAVGEVIESRHADFTVGAVVEGRFGWQHYAKANGAGVNRVSGALGSPANALGIGGLPGFTAYVGLHVADLKPGQTILVSGAAGAVGSVVGPMAKARGLRAVGIASGTEKCRYLIDQAGYDVAVDRTAPDFAAKLAVAVPDGVDCYFDNVGGPMAGMVIPLLARGGLILISGLMAQYQGQPETSGSDKTSSARDNLPALLEAIMGNGVRIRSFTQYGQDALRAGFEAEVATLAATGALHVPMHIELGIERLPHALCGLFEKGVTGKVAVQVGTLPAGVGSDARAFEESV